MVFKRFVEVGRVILINYGTLKNKLAVVVDILTTNRVLIDGPQIRRQELSLNRVSLTDIKIDIPRSAKHNKVIEEYKAKKVDEEFKKSAFAKKLQVRTKRHNLTDFDRFKVMRLRQKRAALRRAILSNKKKPEIKIEHEKIEKKEKKEKKEEKKHEEKEKKVEKQQKTKKEPKQKKDKGKEKK